MADVGIVAILVIATLIGIVVQGAPLLLLAAVAYALLRNRAPRTLTALVVSGIAAVGLTPAVGFHLSVAAAYTLVWNDVVTYRSVFVSHIVTWALLFLILVGVDWLRRRRAQRA
jgi:hypothetical protein